MLRWKTALTLASSIGIVLVASAQAQTSGKPAAGPPALTPQDYLEIRQLVARYAYAVDTGADNGAVYASLFASDGAFLDRTGRATTGFENLVALARRNTRGQQSAFHFIMNHVIEPTADGAIGKEYLAQLKIGEGGKASEVSGAACVGCAEKSA